MDDWTAWSYLDENDNSTEYCDEQILRDMTGKGNRPCTTRKGRIWHALTNTRPLIKKHLWGGALKAHTVQRPWISRGQSPFQRPPYERWTGSYLHKSRDFTKLDALST